jgi:hypothetical protein
VRDQFVEIASRRTIRVVGVGDGLLVGGGEEAQDE